MFLQLAVKMFLRVKDNLTQNPAISTASVPLVGSPGAPSSASPQDGKDCRWRQEVVRPLSLRPTEGD